MRVSDGQHAGVTAVPAASRRSADRKGAPDQHGGQTFADALGVASPTQAASRGQAARSPEAYAARVYDDPRFMPKPFSPAGDSQSVAPRESSATRRSAPQPALQAVSQPERKAQAAPPPKAAAQPPLPEISDFGDLSAHFESKEHGPAAVGYDSHGGVSLGSFQLTTKHGSVDGFIAFLADRRPDWAARLKSADAADDRSKAGPRGQLPKTWKAIAKEDPEGFEAEQRAFAAQAFYRPAVERAEEKSGVRIDERSRAVREAVFSAAVQHGPYGAGNLTARAAERVNRRKVDGQDYDKALIDEMYAGRKNRLGNLSPDIRRAVARRLDQERSMAQTMLARGETLQPALAENRAAPGAAVGAPEKALASAALTPPSVYGGASGGLDLEA